jgi:N-acetylneuraminic acid mutarotase
MLVFGANLEYNPGTNTWSALRKSIPQGIVAWTGREAIGWGGGCCGDVRSDGAAYNPTTDTYRKLPGSPLAPSQEPIGAWDGRDLLLFGSGYDIAGKPTPARFARAAAYNPATNRWRRIAAPPLHGRFAGTAVSAGGEVLVIGAGANAQSTLAYNPSANRWRRLAPLPSSRTGASVVWTGSRLLVFGGQSLNGSGDLRAGLSYDPGTNRWSVLPQPPLRAPGASIAWTGRSLLVFGGVIGSSAATHNKQIWLHGVAGFTPATP